MKLASFQSALKGFKRMIRGKKTDSASSDSGSQKTQPASASPIKEIAQEIEDNGLLFLVTGPIKTLKSGSLHALVNYLIDVKMNDLGFIYAFLIHHVAFIKSWNLLEILLEKWKERAEDHSEHAKAEVFR
jgi:CHAT domain-containing protein